MHRARREALRFGNCHLGDKNPFVPQSDDQFFIHDYAIKQGWRPFLERNPFPGGGGLIRLTVPELELFNMLPFDAQLHRKVVELQGA